MGMTPVVAPIFELRALDWVLPDPEQIDAILLTSANAARFGGEGLRPLLGMPCYAVGDATASAARAAGFRHVIAGDADGATLLDIMAETGIRNPLHLCGREHVPLARPDMRIERRIVYAAEAVPKLPHQAVQALGQGAVAMIHSARAASHFAGLVDQERIDRGRIPIVAISAQAAAAAGEGWRRIQASAQPSDQALLELAAKLCQIDPSETGNGE